MYYIIRGDHAALLGYDHWVIRNEAIEHPEEMVICQDVYAARKILENLPTAFTTVFKCCPVGRVKLRSFWKITVNPDGSFSEGPLAAPFEEDISIEVSYNKCFSESDHVRLVHYLKFLKEKTPSNVMSPAYYIERRKFDHFDEEECTPIHSSLRHTYANVSVNKTADESSSDTSPFSDMSDVLERELDDYEEPSIEDCSGQLSMSEDKDRIDKMRVLASMMNTTGKLTDPEYRGLNSELVNKILKSHNTEDDSFIRDPEIKQILEDNIGSNPGITSENLADSNSSLELEENMEKDQSVDSASTKTVSNSKPIVLRNSKPQIDNEYVQQVVTVLDEVLNLLTVTKSVFIKAKEEVATCDMQVQDLLHYIEFNELTPELSVLAIKQLHAVATKRREYKVVLETIQRMSSVFNTLSSLKLETKLKRLQAIDNRYYTLRDPDKFNMPLTDTDSESINSNSLDSTAGSEDISAYESKEKDTDADESEEVDTSKDSSEDTSEDSSEDTSESIVDLIDDSIKRLSEVLHPPENLQTDSSSTQVSVEQNINSDSEESESDVLKLYNNSLSISVTSSNNQSETDSEEIEEENPPKAV